MSELLGDLRHHQEDHPGIQRDAAARDPAGCPFTADAGARKEAGGEEATAALIPAPAAALVRPRPLHPLAAPETVSRTRTHEASHRESDSAPDALALRARWGCGPPAPTTTHNA